MTYTATTDVVALKHQQVRITLLAVFFFWMTPSFGIGPDSIYTSSKAGVRFECDASYYLYSPHLSQAQVFDSIFNSLIKIIGPRDTNLKILILVDVEGTWWDDRKHIKAPETPFITLGFDTLQASNRNYIWNYYDELKIDTLPGQDKAVSINFTNRSESPEVGLKLIFNGTHSPLIAWDKIGALLRYGVRHIEEVKRNQKNVIAGYCCNGKIVWLKTIDTFKIRHIVDGNEHIELEPSKRDYIALFTILVLLIISIYFTAKQKSAARGSL